MFRVKVALITAGLVAIVAGLSFTYVTMVFTDHVTRQVENTVDHAEQSFLRSARLEALDLTLAAAAMAREPEFVKLFPYTDEDTVRRQTYAELEVRRVRLKEKDPDKRGAAIIAVVNKAGKVIARDLNPTTSYGDDLKTKYPAVASALAGNANKDIWNYEGAMYRVGVAPIHGTNNQIEGALLIGYVQSSSDAKAERDRLGTEVAYFLDGKLQASSFQRAADKSESAEEKELAAALFDGARQAAVEASGSTPPFHLRIGSEVWVAEAARIPGNTTKSKSGFVVLSSLTAAQAVIAPIQITIVLLGLMGFLMTLGAAILTARRFLNPLDQIEAGVTEVINGNREYEFESPSPDFEGLANGLNVMLARLLGRPEPGDEESGESSDGGDDSLFVDEAAAAAAGGLAVGAEADALASEPVETYYQRIWQEYSSARQQTGEGVEGLNAEQFLAKLKQNEAALCKKYSARMVRFKVQIKGNQTTLKPVPIA